MPQFVDVCRAPAWSQIVVFGSVFILLGIVSDGAYALLASSLAHRLKQSRRFVSVRRFFTGGTLIALGVGATVSGSRTSTS